MASQGNTNSVPDYEPKSRIHCFFYQTNDLNGSLGLLKDTDKTSST